MLSHFLKGCSLPFFAPLQPFTLRCQSTEKKGLLHPAETGAEEMGGTV